MCRDEDARNPRTIDLRDLGTTLTNLTILWMSRCGLADLDGISSLNHIRVSYVCFGRNVQSFIYQELYVSFNSITECSPLTMLDKLEVIDLEG